MRLYLIKAKPLTTFLLAICLINAANAQVNVGYPQPLGGRFVMDDLLKFSIMNTGIEKQQVSARIIVTDQTGSKVLDALTNSANLETGSTIIPGNLVFNKIDFTNTRYRDYIYNNRNELPPGNYRIAIIILETGTGEELGREEFDIESEYLNPPILVTPFDGDELELLQPMFTWLPPTPVSPNLALTYKIRVVELMPSQNINEAISKNPPWLEKAGLPTLRLLYPPEARAMDNSKHYAWQIEAYADGIFIGRSEAWMYKFKNNIPKTKKSTDIIQSYAVVKKLKDQGFYLAINKLKFKFDEEYDGGILQVFVYNVHHQVVWSGNGALIKKMGINKYQLDLSKIKEISSGGYYELEVVNDKSEKFSINFRYIKESEE